MRVGLFIPCYVDAFFPDVGIATLQLLERLGIDVVYPLDQTCCGQPMANRSAQAFGSRTTSTGVIGFVLHTPL
jgi:L-lactate dehydrogenase complex protein LldE